MSSWLIEMVEDPAVLVAGSRLFDHPVTMDGAEDFLGRQGHLLLLARASDGCGVGFVSGVESDNDPALATYRSSGATVDAGSVFITWDDTEPSPS